MALMEAICFCVAGDGMKFGSGSKSESESYSGWVLEVVVCEVGEGMGDGMGEMMGEYGGEYGMGEKLFFLEDNGLAEVNNGDRGAGEYRVGIMGVGLMIVGRGGGSDCGNEEEGDGWEPIVGLGLLIAVAE